MNGVLNIQVRMLTKEAQAQLKQLEREIAAMDKAMDGQGGAARRSTIANDNLKASTRDLAAANKELAAAQRAVIAANRELAASTGRIAAAEQTYLDKVMKHTQAIRARDAVLESSAQKQAEAAKAEQAAIRAKEGLTLAENKLTEATLKANAAKEAFDSEYAAGRGDVSIATTNKLAKAMRDLEGAEIAVARATRELANQSQFSATQQGKAASAAQTLAQKEEAVISTQRAAMAAAEKLTAAHMAVAAAETERVASAERLAAATVAATSATQASSVAGMAASSASASAAAAGAVGGLAAAGNSMRKFGSQTQWAGRQLHTNFTMPVLLAGGLATKFALDNERAMTRVRKVYGELGMDATQRAAELEALGRAFEMLSNHFGVQQEQVLEIAGAWAAAGAAGRGLAEGVKNTLETMILGEIEAAEATEALIAIQAQYDLSTKQLSRTIGELNIIENQTGASLSDLITGFSRAAGMANLVGVDTRHLGAMIAALVPAAGSAANAGNSLKTIFARLIAPTKEAKQILHAVGLETDAMSWKNANATEKLEALNKKFYSYSKGQRAVIAQTLAGTYQVSRFGELMDSMHGEVDNGTKNLSQYEKALQATADRTAYMRQKEQELQTVLESNPQKMKQVWVVLQNTLARAIIPAIPAIIMMAGMIQKLFEKFQELPPYVRKAILAFVLFAAILGPILRLVGSFILLGGYVVKMFTAMKLSGKGLAKVWQMTLGRAITMLIGAVGGVPLAIGAAIAATLALLWQVPGVSEKITAAVHRAFNSLPAAVQGPLMAVYRIVKTIVLAIYKMFSYLNPFARHSPSLVDNVTNGMRVIRDEFATISSIHGPIMKAYADIKKFNDATADLRQGLDSISRAQDLKELAKLAPGAVDEFKALVKDLQVLTPIMERLKQQVDDQQRVVDEWEDKLDQANDALDKQQDKLRELSDVAEHYSSLLSDAKDDLEKFANAPITGMRAMEDQIFANEMAQKALRLEMMNLEEVNGPYDDLKQRLEALNGEIELLKGEQADLRNAGAGSEVLSVYDQQIQALEDQQAAIGNTASEYNSLQAQLDALQRAGEKLDLQKSLNFDGLLRQIDQTAHVVEELPFEEIMAGISGAKDRIAEYEAALAAANAEVDKQQQKVDAAQKKVDSINASYQAQRDQLDAISAKYDKVRDAVDAVTSALSDMISAVEEANRQGVKKGKGGEYTSNALDSFNDAAGGDFADVGGTSGLGREGGLPEIEDFIRQLEQDQADLAARIDLFKPLRDMVDKFKDWWYRNFTAKWHNMWTDVVSGTDNMSLSGPKIRFEDSDLKNKVDKFNSTVVGGINRGVEEIIRIIEMIVKIVRPVIELFADDFQDIFVSAIHKGQEAVEKIWPEIKKFGDLLGPIWGALKNVGIAVGIIATVLGVLLAPIVAALIGALKIMYSVWANMIGPILTFVIETIANLIRQIRGMVELVAGVLTGDWQLAWQGIKDIFGSMFDQMLNIVTAFPALIWAIIKGFVEGVRDFFVWLWDVLVGHSIIPDMINAIVDWFIKMPGRILGALANLGQMLWDLIQAAWNKLQSGLETAWSATWTFIKGLPQKFWDGLMGAVDFYKNLGSTIINKVKEGLVDAWSAVSTWLGEKIEWFAKKFGDLKSDLAGKFTGMFDGIKEAFKAAINFIIRGWNSLRFEVPEIDTHIPGVGKVGGFGVGVPPIPELRAMGGSVRAAQPYIVGERGPEFFVPSSSGRIGTNDALQRLLSNEIDRLTSNLMTGIASEAAKATVPALAEAAVARADTRVAGADTTATAYQPTVVNNTTEIHFHGDLSFPNIKTGEDAQTFLTNLSDLAG